MAGYGAMTSNETKKLCLSLLKTDTEETVISILKRLGLWEDPALWRYFGDREDNFSTIGNQQSHPESALVEKVVNAVDARLMNECMARGVNPKAPEAPTSIHEAVALYFEDKTIKDDRAARLYVWATDKRTEVARGISVAATGERRNPCFTVSDIGEGQTPDDMPSTLLSLDKQNKLRIHFVQGKFNMGGTGVLKFCGHENLQLVISRRNPRIAETFNRDDDSRGEWGFTIIRRENPAHGEKSSVYTYLAPLGAERSPRNGGVLRLRSGTMPLMPQGRDAYARPVEWGTTIKLYEYAATGFRTNMMLRDGARYRLDILLPDIALPIRLYECRDFKGHTGSFETTLSGLTVRLEDNKAENLEGGFPVACPFMAAGQKMTARIYAFKKRKAETYRKNEGIIFTVNGQTHGHLPLSFFHRNKVRMGRLADSLLVVVDCTRLTRRACEDLFMNSRDRLSGGELRSEIERELEELLSTHAALKELCERRTREEIEARLEDSKPLEDVLESILRSSPSLSALFLTGHRLGNPFKQKRVGSEDRYQGKLHPTFFKFRNQPYGEVLVRTAPVNHRCRIAFETDVVNDYFDRPENKGVLELGVVEGLESSNGITYSLNLRDGVATLNLKLPGRAKVGDTAKLQASVSDDTLTEPFVNTFVVTVDKAQPGGNGNTGGRTPPRSKGQGDDHDAPVGIQLPIIIPVTTAEWGEHGFDRYSAVKIAQNTLNNGNENGPKSKLVYDFFVNVDNVHLQVEMKASRIDADILKARFTFGMVLVGLALIQDHQAKERQIESAGHNGNNGGQDEEPTIERRVHETTRAVAPMILPMIDSLGSLSDRLPVGAGKLGYED